MAEKMQNPIDKSIWWYENNYGPQVNKRAITEIKLMASKIDEQHEQMRQLLFKFWDVLDGILVHGDGDTIWANDFVTAHEALVEIADEYAPDVAEQLQLRLEE